MPGDGGAVLKPLTDNTFDEYALNVFLPFIFTQLQRVSRVDITWDQYHENSLKSHTKSKRGKEIMIRVASLPGNWQQLLRINANKSLQINANKSELFSFLVKHISHKR